MMTEIEFVGLFFGALIPVFGSVIALIKFFTKPMVELNTSIVKLNDSIEKLNCDIDRQDHRLDVHGEKIDHLENKVTEHETEIKNLKHYHKID